MPPGRGLPSHARTPGEPVQEFPGPLDVRPPVCEGLPPRIGERAHLAGGALAVVGVLVHGQPLLLQPGEDAVHRGRAHPGIRYAELGKPLHERVTVARLLVEQEEDGGKDEVPGNIAAAAEGRPPARAPPAPPLEQQHSDPTSW